MVIEWKEKKLSDIADVKTGPFGSALHASDYVMIGTPIITVEHLGENGIVHTNLPLVSKDDYYRLSMYSLRPGDIVFSRVGSVDRNAYISIAENDWLFSGRLLRIRIISKEVDALYLSYYFKDFRTKIRIYEVAVGQTMASLNTKILNDFLISYPPLVEQRDIAAALSDVDAYILALEKLIAKKRVIKQGVMQELLSGKRRLPGFKREWFEKKIEDIGDTSSGGTPSRAISSYFNGDIPWVTTSELNDTYIFTTVEKITDEALKNSSAKLFPKGTTLMAMYGATIGKLGILKVDASTNQACCALFFKTDIDALFMYYILLCHRNEIIELGSGAGQPNISQKIIRQLSFKIPPTKDEQTAIAEIIFDMDAEIDAMISKLNKLKHIKLGMMSELLTGRIRFVENVGAFMVDSARKIMEMRELEHP